MTLSSLLDDDSSEYEHDIFIHQKVYLENGRH